MPLRQKMSHVSIFLSLSFPLSLFPCLSIFLSLSFPLSFFLFIGQVSVSYVIFHISCPCNSCNLLYISTKGKLISLRQSLLPSSSSLSFSSLCRIGLNLLMHLLIYISIEQMSTFPTQLMTCVDLWD